MPLPTWNPCPKRETSLVAAVTKLITDGHRSPSISFMKASYTSSLVCTETGAAETALGVALVIWTECSSSGFLWEAAAAPLFSRRTRRAVGTKRVISALGLVICGLALIVAVAFFSMVAALVSSTLGRWIKLGGALSTPGFGMGAGGNNPGGGTNGGRSMPGRGGGIPIRKERLSLHEDKQKTKDEHITAILSVVWLLFSQAHFLSKLHALGYASTMFRRCTNS